MHPARQVLCRSAVVQRSDHRAELRRGDRSAERRRNGTALALLDACLCTTTPIIDQVDEEKSMGQARVSESQARTWLMVILVGVLLAGCGADSEAGDEQAADAATEPDATTTSPVPQADATQPEGSPSPSAAGTQASSGAFSGQSIEFVVPY